MWISSVQTGLISMFTFQSLPQRHKVHKEHEEETRKLKILLIQLMHPPRLFGKAGVLGVRSFQLHPIIGDFVVADVAARHG